MNIIQEYEYLKKKCKLIKKILKMVSKFKREYNKKYSFGSWKKKQKNFENLKINNK